MPTYLKVTKRGDLENLDEDQWPITGEAFGLSTGGGRDSKAAGHDWWVLIDKFRFDWTNPDANDSSEERQRRIRQAMNRRAPSTRGGEAAAGAGPNFAEIMEKERDRQDPKITITKEGNTSSPQFVDWMTYGHVYDMRIEVCAENDEMLMRVDVIGAMVDEFETTLSNSGGEVDDTQVEDEIKIKYEELRVMTLVENERGEAVPTAGVISQGSEAGGSGTGSGSGGGGGDGAPASVPAGAAIGMAPGQGAVATEAASGRAAASVVGSETETEMRIVPDRRLVVDDGETFQLRAYQGVEQMSRPFEFRLELSSTDLEVDGAAMIGQPMAFSIVDSSENEEERGEPRLFHGIVREFVSGNVGDDVRSYEAVLVPEIWFLQQRTDCRIYQNMKPLAIIEDVFERIGLTDYDKSNVRGDYPELEYCVQYRESDFNFVHRLMEEYGIFYFFRFEQSRHLMVLADGKAAHADCDEKEIVQSKGDKETLKKVSEWTRRLVHVPGQAAARDYTHTDPTSRLESVVPSKIELQNSDKYELFDYPGRYADEQVGDQLVGIRIEREEAEHDLVEGSGNYPEFTVGTKFKVVEHDAPSEVDQEFVLTRVEHMGTQLPKGMKERLSYSNRFACIPAETTFRSPTLTPRPRVEGPQTAVVVGTQNEEIDTDKFASVKLAFFWDRECPGDEGSSCWARVAQSQAHKNWGGVAIPRIGQEVVVEFLEGNPDRPIVVGAVYNEDNQPPWDLPANKTATGWKSRSSKDGKAEHFNELRFEDKKGEELIYFHAEKDFERVVQHDDTLTVGEDGEGEQTITVETDQTQTIKKNQTLTVGENGDGSQTITVEKDRTVTVANGDETYNVDMGSRTSNIKMGDDTVNVKMGNHSLTLNMGDQTTHAKLGKITLKAMQSIELKVGSNSIKVDMTGVEIKGMMVKAKGELMTEVKGMMTTVKGDAMLKAGGGLTMIG